MAMRAQMAKAVTKGAKRVSRKKRKNMTLMQTKEEEDEGGEQNVEDSTKFWLGVAEHMEKYRYEREHPVKDPREEKRQSRLSRMSKRRPSLQLSEKLKLIKPKVMIPSFVRNAIDNIPVVSPNHTLKVRWDIVLGALIFYSVIVIPLRVGFSIESNPDIELSDIIIDSMFGMDILVSFDTALIGDEDELVEDRRIIAKEYLKGWFLIDLLSTVPIDKLVALMTKADGDAKGGGKLIRILRLARLMKLTRVLKLGKFLKNVDMDAVNPAAFGLFSLFFKILFTGHLISCFWYFMTSDTVDLDPSEVSWNDEFEIGGRAISNCTLMEEYTAAFYWSIATMMAVGYGDIYAVNSKERLYSICAQLVGAISFGAMIATVNILVASSDPRARAYKAKMGELKAYLNEREVPKGLGEEIKTAFKYFMSKKSVFGERDLVMDLPSSIRTQLVKAAYEVDIQKLTYLKNEDSAYVCYLMLSMRPFNCLPGEVLLEQNDIADEVVFLLRGTVHMVRRGPDIDDAASELVEDSENFPFDETTPCVVGVCSEGGFFGDLGYRKKAPRVASYEAINICQMLSISRLELDNANHMYAISGKHFGEETDKRLVVFEEALNSEIIALSNGRISKKDIFVDGVLVHAENIKMSASQNHLKIKQEGGKSKPPGIKRMNSSELLTGNNIGRRPSSSSLNINDLDTSNHGVDTPTKQDMGRKRSFKTRRTSVSGGGGAIGQLTGGLAGGEFEEKDETVMDLLKRGIIEPNLPIKMKWDMFVGVLIVFSVITIPYRLGFDVPPTPQSEVQDVFVDTIFWLDIFITFRCAYEDAENDILVTVPSDIAKNYFKTWFFIDFFSVFPIAEIVEYFLVGDSLPVDAGANSTLAANDEQAEQLESLKLLKVVRLVRLMKLVRLLKLGTYLEKIEDEFSINPAAFELFKLLLQVTFIAHMFGCFWFFTSVQTTEVEHSWYYSLEDTDTIEDKYIASLYWAFTTMTTVGYGDIPAMSVPEKWYAVIIMMLGATVFGYILAHIATLMGQLNARESRVNANITSMTEYLSEKNIQKGLVKSIKTHIRFNLSCTSVFDEYSIMQKLPTSLARKLFYHNHKETLTNICLFNYLKSTGVIMYVFNMLYPAQYADGHEIFAENSIPNDIYFVYAGKANILKTIKTTDGDSERIVCGQVTPGQIVGYLGMLKSTVHKHSCVAKGSLSVYFLHIHDLTNAMFEHPFVSERLQMALGKCILEQNELFKKRAETQRNKKFTEIMFAQSNLLNTEDEVNRGEAMNVEEDELTQVAEGKASPQHILTPKFARMSNAASPDPEFMAKFNISSGMAPVTEGEGDGDSEEDDEGGGEKPKIGMFGGSVRVHPGDDGAKGDTAKGDTAKGDTAKGDTEDVDVKTPIVKPAALSPLKKAPLVGPPRDQLRSSPSWGKKDMKEALVGGVDLGTEGEGGGGGGEVEKGKTEATNVT
ncbi:hypothetical protein TrVE_jg10696 [Triparma verrucosa]|uniref:Cyclic nucleotide-binding domain-containing protein n=1 Tax=Triparma verrucosa TaxID=1606542 RepID=A0A9W7BFD4_9STRA|nr:hypothetical protein TrVE_jg10696 [Triparma verrucosa]